MFAAETNSTRKACGGEPTSGKIVQSGLSTDQKDQDVEDFFSGLHDLWHGVADLSCRDSESEVSSFESDSADYQAMISATGASHPTRAVQKLKVPAGGKIGRICLMLIVSSHCQSMAFPMWHWRSFCRLLL